MGDLTSISQVIGRQEPSWVWLSDQRICQDCGQSFDVKWRQETEQPGRPLRIQPIPTRTICQECFEKRADQDERLALLTALQEAIEDERSAWWETCGVPTRFATKTFANFQRDLQPRAYDALQSYSYREKDEKPAQSLVLLSPNLYGVGKTHLVCALVDLIISTAETAVLGSRGIIRRRCPVYFVREAQLLSQIRATYSSKEGDNEEDIYERLADYPLLILDDVGKVRPRDYSFLQGVYYRLIDDRYTSEQPVIMTTNLDYAELEKHLGGATADRLREMCGRTGFIKMTGKSFRSTDT